MAKSERNVWRGIVAGLAGGLVASWVMNQFQEYTAKGFEETGQKPQDEGGGDATEKAAQAVSEKVFDHHLTPTEKKIAAPAVHYAFGAANGALYGALTELAPGVALGYGTLFGGLLWFAADEIGVPALKLSRQPNEYRVSTHAQALASHLVYGLTTDIVARTLRAAT